MPKLVSRLCACALVLLFVLLGCSAAESETEPSDILGEALSDAPSDTSDSAARATSFSLPCLQGQTFDPITCPDGAQRNIAALLYEPLFALNSSFTPEGVLCTSYSYDTQTLTFVFSLRTNATFSDGTTLSSADVLATLQRASASERYAPRFACVASMCTEGADAVSVTLTRDNASFPALLDIPIIKSGTERSLVPVGTGPYLYVTDSLGACLQANSDWWRGAIQPIERIPLSSVKDMDTLSCLFLSHEIQLLTCDLTGSDSISTSGSVSFTEVPTSILQYLICNTSDASPLSDAALRRTIERGIDRASLVSAQLSGHAQSVQFPLSPTAPLYPSSLEIPYSRSQRIDKPDLREPLRLIVNSENRFKVAASEFIAGQLTALGIPTQAKELSWEEYLHALERGSFDLCYAEVQLTADWDISPLVATGGKLNYGHYANERMDSLLASALSLPSEQTDDLCAYLQQEAPIIPLCFKTYSLLLQSGTADHLSPTAANPFYAFEQWQFHIGE